MNTQSVTIDLIDIPANARKASSSLIESVSISGLLHPIALQEADEGRFRLIYGARRLDAVKAVGRNEIDALVFSSDIGAATCRLLALVENLERAALTPLEIGDELLALLGLGVSRAQLAKRLSRPLSWITARLRIASLPPLARSLLAPGTYNTTAAALLARLPPRQFVEFVEQNPEVATSVDLAKDALRKHAPLLGDARFDKSDCASCDKRFDDDLCLDSRCFDQKTAAHVGSVIARIRQTHPTAPCLVEKRTWDFADVADMRIFNANGAKPLIDARIAGDDEPDASPAILIGEHGAVRLIHVVPDPHESDGRAACRLSDQELRLEQKRVTTIAQVVHRLLKDRMSGPPREIDDQQFGLLVMQLAECAVGVDVLTPSAAFHALLRICAPQVSKHLLQPAFLKTPGKRRANTLRVMQLLSDDPETELDALARGAE